MQKDSDNTPLHAKIFFIYSGIASLLGWNALMTAFDFYIKQYPDYNVPFIFPIPKFVSQVIALLMIYKISQYVSMNIRIVGLLILMSALLVVLPIVAVFLDNTAGFWISALLIFIFGYANAIMQGSCVALTSLFPVNCIGLFFTGTGLAGCLISLIRVFILLGFGDDDAGLIIGTIVYFSISGVIQLITVFIYLRFVNTDYAKVFIEKSRQRSMSHTDNISDNIAVPMKDIDKHNDYISENENNLEEKLQNKTGDEDTHMLVLDKQIKREIIEEHLDKNDSKFVLRVLKKIWLMVFLLWFIYLVTFMMFPGVTLKRKVESVSMSWGVTLLILVFNIFDTIGKYIAKLRWTYNAASTSILIFGRMIFFLSFLVMAMRNDATIICTDWFQFLNIAAFALTNGYATTSTMVLAPEYVSDGEKETCGFIMSFPLAFGIVSGTFVALAFQNI